MKILLVGFCSLLQLAVISTSAWAISSSTDTPAIPILNFKKVEDGIFRGGRPTPEGLAALKKLGIKTIIDLENAPAVIQAEKLVANQQKMQFISYSMDYKTSPDPNQVARVLTAINSQKNQPVFVHCKHGQDRTGLIIGLYRMKFDKWTGKEAYAEMIANHFHPMFKNLTAYFKSQE